MLLKIASKIIFDKKRFVIAFALVCVILTTLMAFQSMSLRRNISKSKSLPDFVFFGTVFQSQDGSYPFKAFNETNQLATEIQKELGDRGEVHRVVCRSLYNYYDERSNIGFSGYVYGLPEQYMEETFQHSLITGRLPEKGKKEAAVGVYFANRFHLEVGDPIPQSITLNATWDESDIDAYVVSGIIGEDINDMFIGSAIISLETFEEYNGKSEENALFGMFHQEDEELNLSMFIEFNQMAGNNQVPEGKLLYVKNNFETSKTIFFGVLVGVICLIILTILVSLLAKGLSLKIGLMKAIGISESNIIRLFLRTMFLITIGAALLGGLLTCLISKGINAYVTDFYSFPASVFSMNTSTLLSIAVTALVVFLLVGISITVNAKKISPRSAIAS